MRIHRHLFAMLALAGWLVTSALPADAAPINSRPKFSSAELSELAAAFDGITSDGDYDIDVYKDQQSAAIFHPVSSFASHSKMVSQITSIASGAEFGLYKFGDTSTKIKLFDSSSDPSKAVSLEWDDVDGEGDILDLTAYGIGFTQTTINDFGLDFGMYYSFASPTGGGTSTWYSEDSLNNDAAHMLIYESNPNEQVNIDGKMQGGALVYSYDAGHFYVAVEQGGVGSNDDPDFTDLVVQFESITAAPEPTSIMMLGIGGAVLAAARRRRRKTSK